MIKRLDDMFEVLKKHENKRLVAAFANDSHTVGAVSQAVDMGTPVVGAVGKSNT